MIQIIKHILISHTKNRVNRHCTYLFLLPLPKPTPSLYIITSLFPSERKRWRGVCGEPERHRMREWIKKGGEEQGGNNRGLFMTPLSWAKW